MNEEISAQTKILRAITMLNGRANTKQIAEFLGISSNRVNSSTKHLVNRSLVRKKYEDNYQDSRGIKQKIKVFTIREQKREKVIGMIREAYGEI